LIDQEKKCTEAKDDYQRHRISCPCCVNWRKIYWHKEPEHPELDERLFTKKYYDDRIRTAPGLNASKHWSKI